MDNECFREINGKITEHYATLSRGMIKHFLIFNEIKKENIDALESPYREFYTGMMYECGFHFEQDLRQALVFYKKGYDAGLIICCRFMGSVYSKLDNIDEAINYFQEGIDKGDVSCINSLGFLYSEKKNDEKSAIGLYRAAAAKGNSLAMCNIFVAYYHDKENGIVDEVEAKKNLDEAMKNNYYKAFMFAGNVSENDDDIFSYFRKAHELYDKDISVICLLVLQTMKMQNDQFNTYYDKFEEIVSKIEIKSDLTCEHPFLEEGEKKRINYVIKAIAMIIHDQMSHEIETEQNDTQNT